jgi:hypothetical protein
LASAGLSRQWWEERLADVIDRAIDEVFVAYDRLAAARKRKTAWRTLTVQYPASVRDNGEP